MTIDGSCLTTYIATKTKLIVKKRLKLIVVLLFLFSVLFLSYQFIYYANLNTYQTQEVRQRLVSSGSRGQQGHLSLKDIAYHLEQDKLKQNFVGLGGHKGHQEIPVPSKGDTGPLKKPLGIGEGQGSRRGKPIFSEHVLGVAPEAQKFYIKQQQRNKSFFSCLTSGKQISWDKVNDDFCDCPSDGSDEPSTAACMNGRFFCSIIKEGYPEYVPSSMVNDGICDCVDGSDEHNRMNSITCKNRS